MSTLFNPTTNPKEAFAWDLKKIGEYLDDVQKNPTKYCSNPAYNKPVTDGHPDTKPRIHVVAAAEFIKSCAYAKVPHIFNANLPGIGVEFEGCQLPDNTIYDVLGWLLSVCSEPQADATDRNYYLPLTALFGRWCRLLGGDIKFTPPMVHIAWFKGKSGKMLVLLGSTIGVIDTPLRQSAVERERQSELIALKFEPKDSDGQLVKSDKFICRQGTIVNEVFQIKSLAETFKNDPQKKAELAEEWVKSGLTKSIVNEKTVKGFALRPRLLRNQVSDFQKLTTYDEVAAAKVLAPPCENSCQFLIPQLGTLDKDPPWKWQNIFDVAKLQREIGTGSTQAAANAPGPSTNAAVKPAAGAGGKTKPTFKGEMAKVVASAAPALVS